MRIYRLITGVILCCLLAGCGSEGQSGGGVQSYKDTKSMVLDILKSEDAKKAIEESMNSPVGNAGMQALSLRDNEQIRIAVKDVLTDPSYPQHLEKLMLDPKFSAEFAKAVSKENKALHKDLMKDPEYQTMMVSVMKGPEFEKMMLDIMKSSAYRKQAMAIFQESLENPLFRLELMELMKKVMEEETRPKAEKEAAKQKESSEGDSASSNEE